MGGRFAVDTDNAPDGIGGRGDLGCEGGKGRDVKRERKGARREEGEGEAVGKGCGGLAGCDVGFSILFSRCESVVCESQCAEGACVR